MAKDLSFSFSIISSKEHSGLISFRMAGPITSWQIEGRKAEVVTDFLFLDSKEIQPVHPKGDQSWVFIGRTDVEAETPILWPPDANS